VKRWGEFDAYDGTATYPSDKVAASALVLDRADILATSPEMKTRIAMYRALYDYMAAYGRVYDLYHNGRFTEGLVELEKLPKAIAAAQAIQPGMLPPDVEYIAKEGNGLEHLRGRLSTMAGRAGGDKGELLGRAPRQAQFLADPKNIGLYDQWQREEIGAQQKWQPIDLTKDWGLNGHRDSQGLAYDGIGWYRIAMQIKKPAQGRAQLCVPLVFADKAWVWFNGQLVCSPTNVTADRKAVPLPGQATRRDRRGHVELGIDVHDQLRPDAENVITFRLQGTMERTEHRGLAEVPFVWAPK